MSTPSELLEEAVKQHLAGNGARAEALYQDVLVQNPHDVTALSNLATIALGQRRYERALELASAAVESDPKHPFAWNTRGFALSRLNNLSDAIESYDLAIGLKPGFVNAYTNRASALLDLGFPARARADCEQALALKPDTAVAHSVLGAALRELHAYDAAIQSFERALALAPKLIEAHNGLATVLLRLGRTTEAVAVSDRAIACDPTCGESYNDRGAILVALKRYDEALACYDRAIALRADYGDACWNKSLLLLLLGRYEEGWSLYEWRWKSRSLVHAARHFDAPLWNGEELAGKTVLLYAEQGFGDTIQFARYAPLVSAWTGKIILEVPAPLVGLLSRLDPLVTVIAKGKPLPHFDFQCPLMSLPKIFKTAPDLIPARIPYLSADDKHLSRWQQRLGPTAKPRVGLTWAGRSGYANDYARSMSAENLTPLLEADCEFHCLQRDITAADRVWLDAHPEVRWYGEEIATFEDSAALASLMDHVVTVDTAAAHLAGALGKPTAIFLAFAPDFRWFTERVDTPWYPTARLVRQSAPGNWTQPIMQVKVQLQQLAAQSSGA